MTPSPVLPNSITNRLRQKLVWEWGVATQIPKIVEGDLEQHKEWKWQNFGSTDT